MDKLIVLVSDFGDKFATSQLELVIHSINSKAKFIIGANDITPFSLIEGSFVLGELYKLSPKGTIFITVIDPGVGSERKAIIIKTKNHYFIGPDNGVLYKAASKDGIEEVWQIDLKKISSSISNTFHGRDLFAKVAAKISLGEVITNFARQLDKNNLQKIDFILNQVLHIDDYGNLKINSTNNIHLGDKVKISSKRGNIKALCCNTFSDVRAGEFLIYQGSHKLWEVAKNLGSAATDLQVDIGDQLKIELDN